METLTTLSPEDLQHLLTLVSKVPAATNWDYLHTGLREVLADHAAGVEAGLWWPNPEGFVSLTAKAGEVFGPYVGSREVEEVNQEPNAFVAVPGGFRFPIMANRQVFGQILLSAAPEREAFVRNLAAVLAGPLGLAALGVQLGEEVSKRTSTDKLTGLWNRQYFNERFREECERLVRSKETGSVVLLSFDSFAALARTMPADEQATLFGQLGVAVRQVIRQTDWGVRWDNFDLLFYFPSTTAEAAVEVLKRFSRKLSSVSPVLEPLSGVSSTVETTSPRALIQLATRRLDLARKDGSRRVICFATPGGGLQFFRETEA